jgi:hypothetical protein
MTATLVLLALRLLPGPEQAEFRQPQLATDGRRAGVVFGSGQAIYFAQSPDFGKSFSAPVLVSKPGKLSLGRHRGPRIAFTPQAIVISAIAGQKGGGADGDLLSWRSTDGGKTWSAAVTVNDVPGAAREGLHAMASGSGLLFATWLDLRAQGTRLYGALSRDGGQTWSKNKLVYESPSGTICQCCHPSVAIDAKGRIAVMFRNAIDGARDLYLTESNDGASFRPARKLGQGTWMLNACPMDGGGLAFQPAGNPITVWRREKQVFLTAPAEAEKQMGDGKDPAIAAGRKGVYLAWTAPDGVKAFSPGAVAPTVLAAGTEVGYPQLLALADGSVLAVWEAKGRLEFQRLP